MTAMTGANLEQLNELSSDYTKTGQRLIGKADQLATRIRAAIDDFNTTANQLLAQTTQLTSQIETEMGSLSSHAAGVEWTGQNRGRFDADLTTFGQAVRQGAAATRDDITQLQTQIASKFAPSLETFGKSLGDRVTTVNSGAETTSQAVSRQREILDQAANSGWGS